MHHRRFGRDVRRAIPHEDEETTHGPAVLEAEHQDPVDEAREDDLPGHALDHPNDRRKIRRLVHRCAACTGGMPHLRAPAEPTTGRAAPVLDRPPAHPARVGCRDGDMSPVAPSPLWSWPWN